MTAWIICGCTLIAVMALDRLENKYVKSILDWFPAILFAYLIPAAVTRIGGLDLSQHSIHLFSRNFVIPMAILTVMSSLSIRQLRAMGWKPVLVFVAGSFWIALFPVAIVGLFIESGLVREVLQDQEYWKGIPPIVGGWIGGSTSQLVLKELVECPENIFLNILILDNILVNIWTILMFQGIKRTELLDGLLRIGDRQDPGQMPVSGGKAMHAGLCLALLLVGVFGVNALTDNLIVKILLLSAIGLSLSNLIKGWPFSFVLKLGSILIITVMAILGLKLRFDLVEIDLVFLLFLIGWLAGHFFFMLFFAKLLGISTVWVPIASMANVGGIATAPAVTAAYEKRWMPHAILLAVLSMATGTFWGMLTIAALKFYFA